MSNITITMPAIQTVRAQGAEWMVDLGSCPKDLVENVIACLVRQGLGIIAQRANAEAKDEEGNALSLSERHAIIRADLARIESGTYSFGSGGGGGIKISEEMKELRVIVASVLVAAGWKRSAAEGAVRKELEKTVLAYVREKFAKGGRVLSDVQANRAAETYLTKWLDQATANVAARKAASDVELSEDDLALLG